MTIGKNSALLLLIATVAQADDRLSLRYGVGLGASARDGKTETRHVGVAYSKAFNSVLHGYGELVGWADRRTDLGRKSSPALNLGIGSRTEAGVVYAHAFFGAAIIGSPDTILGGRFPQFFQDFGVGLQGSNRVSVGVHFKHISSGGIHEPNFGRDLIGVDLGLPF